MSEIVHIASQPVLVGTTIRQRCVWCGAEIDDTDIRGIAFVDDGGSNNYPTWPGGALIGIDGNATYVVKHEDGDPLPETFCGAPDDPSSLTAQRDEGGSTQPPLTQGEVHVTSPNTRQVLRTGWHPCVECGDTPSAKWQGAADVWLCRKHGHAAVISQVPEGQRERVARAIAEAADDGVFDRDDPDCTSDDEDRAYWLRLADAAIAVHAEGQGQGGDDA